MTHAAPRTFWEWREWLAVRWRAERDTAAEGTTAGTSVADDAAGYPADARPGARHAAGEGDPDEKLLQAIWAQQLVQPTALRLMDGTPLRVIDPGRWNGAAGPDFKGARLLFGERSVEGDIEVHITGRGWVEHGHQRDLDYNGVVLHVLLRADDAATSDTLHNGTRVPRMELEPFIFPDLETVRRSISPDDYAYQAPAGVGRCFRTMSQLPGEQVTAFLDRAGDERLLAKTQRLEQQAAGLEHLPVPERAEHLLYQALMMTLGTGPGRTLYYLLSKRAPLGAVLSEAAEGDAAQEAGVALVIESLLLHVAGLVPDPMELLTAPADSQAHAEALRGEWARLAPYWGDRVIPPTRRWYQGIRPVNFPVRRLGGVARLLARELHIHGGLAAPTTGRGLLHRCCEHIRAARASLENAKPTRRRHPLLVDLAALLQVGGEGQGPGAFWGTHYSFTAQPAARPMDLIGEGSAQSLVLNAVLPAALWLARTQGDGALERAVRALYGLVPPLQPNHVTEFMTRRLFGEREGIGALINTERRRQALFQVFYHCCAGESVHCDRCYYLEG